jgi:hypothetical protein
VATFALVITRLMLEHWLQPPPARQERRTPEMSVERSGTAGGDARALLSWFWRWLRGRLRPSSRPARSPRPEQEATTTDAWRAYRALLDWAAQHGLARRPAETTHELQVRLAEAVPAASEEVELVTSTYEWARYGGVEPPTERLRRIVRAVESLRQQGR